MTSSANNFSTDGAAGDRLDRRFGGSGGMQLVTALPDSPLWPLHPALSATHLDKVANVSANTKRHQVRQPDLADAHRVRAVEYTPAGHLQDEAAGAQNQGLGSISRPQKHHELKSFRDHLRQTSNAGIH